jgi:hypothetical protein
VTRLRSASPRTLAIIAAVAGTVAALAFFVSVMSDSDYRRTGTNAANLPIHLEVPAGHRTCQLHEFVPAKSGAVAPAIVGGPVAATVSSGGRQVAAGRLPARSYAGLTRVPLTPVIPRDLADATVCLVNLGTRPLAVYGDYVPPGRLGVASAPSSGGVDSTVMRLDWYTPRRESWWAGVSRIADRFALVKAPFLGPWAFWAALAVLLGISVAAVFRAVREAAP